MNLLSVINDLRPTVIEQIKSFLNERDADTYVNLFVPYCAGIKYADNEGNLGLYASHYGELSPMSLEDMPIESLLNLLYQLEQRSVRQTVVSS